MTRDCISTSIGLVPSTQLTMAVPASLESLPDNNTFDGLSTSTSPLSVISKTPNSLVEPNLFFTALIILYELYFSPSKYKTVSTKCSKTLGPAIAPSFVTCPTIKQHTFSFLHIFISLLAMSFT